MCVAACLCACMSICLCLCACMSVCMPLFIDACLVVVCVFAFFRLGPL